MLYTHMIFGTIFLRTIFLRTANGARWFSRAALASVAIVNEQHKEGLEEFNKEGTDAPPPPHPPPSGGANVLIWGLPFGVCEITLGSEMLYLWSETWARQD